MNKTKMITMGLFTLCTMGLSHATFAGEKTGNPIGVTYIGKIKNQPVFQLSLNNGQAAEYFISIKDENRDVIFSEKIKGINLTRKYQLAVDEEDLTSPRFGISIEVTSSETHKTQVYKISANTHVVENIVVAKL